LECDKDEEVALMLERDFWVSSEGNYEKNINGKK
jgi:hypothetical protein